MKKIKTKHEHVFKIVNNRHIDYPCFVCECGYKTDYFFHDMKLISSLQFANGSPMYPGTIELNFLRDGFTMMIKIKNIK